MKTIENINKKKRKSKISYLTVQMVKAYILMLMEKNKV